MIPTNVSQGLHLIPNGVFVVASAHEGKVHGCTASWVSQASYRNPLLTIALDKEHETTGMIERSGKVVINVLKAGQQDIAEHFGHEHRGMESGYFRQENGQDTPVVNDCLAAIFGNVVGKLDARDHTVFLVEATDAQVFSKEDPLVFWVDRGYAAPQPK